jgi:hypothetical protein
VHEPTARPGRRNLLTTLLIVLVGCASVVVPGGGVRGATDRHVAVGGTDAGNSCTVQANPCATIGHALSVSMNGDTVVVGPGTFTELVAVPTAGGASIVTILGSLAGTTVDGAGAGSVFTIASGANVTLSQLLIRRGGGPAQTGGGLLNSGATHLVRSTVANNVAGLLFGFGEGGGIYNAAGASLTIDDSTIANNTAAGGFGFGGGINNAGSLSIAGTTIAGNGAGAQGGGISASGPTSVSGTILSDNDAQSGPNCSGVVTDLGRNVDDGTSCAFGPASISNTDPALGPLGANGGPTPTMALAAGSPAVDVPGSSCSATDQRGVPRPQPPGGACDIGAYEYAPGVVVGLAPASGPEAGGTVVTITGHGFTLATDVLFGPAEASFTVSSDTTIVATSPPGTGAVAVRVVTPDGSGPDAPSGVFTYDSIHSTALTANPSIARIHLPTVQVYLKLSARLVGTVAASPVPGQLIVFSVRGRFVCVGTTNVDGTASCTGVVPLVRSVIGGGYDARFAGTSALAPAQSHGVLIALS